MGSACDSHPNRTEGGFEEMTPVLPSARGQGERGDGRAEEGQRGGGGDGLLSSVY